MSSPKKKKPRTILSFFSKSSGSSKETTTDTKQVSSPSTSEKVQDSPVTVPVQNEPEIVPSTSKSQPQPSDKTDVKKPQRNFQEHWLRDYSWLEHDVTGNFMTCKLCIKHKKHNAMTVKNTNFKTTTLTRHASSDDHMNSIEAENLQGQLQKTVNKVMTDQEKAVIVALKSAYWIAQEDLAINKFGSLINLLTELECPEIEHLKATKTVTYESDRTASEMLLSIATVVRRKVDNRLMSSPFISFLLDESTDIATDKKLVVYAQVIDPETFAPSTHFVTNMKVESATGEAIYKELKSVMNTTNRVISQTKVMGLGTDGAKVMTGTGIGLTGFMLRENPMLLNYHCIAHKLALVSSQAANSVPYLVDYQSTLSGMFYFFKSSANRVSKLSAIQEMLDEPSLRIKEVHQVRWLSTYIAVQTVYRTLDSLLTFFTSDADAKSKGYAKKLIQHDFIASTYMLMDVLPIVSKMCLVFQKKDLDVSEVKVEVDHARQELEKMKSEHVPETSYLWELQNKHMNLDKGKAVFKENHIVQGRRNIDTIRIKFLDAILERLSERFPDDDSNVIYALSILAMRPISFLPKAELDTWGNEKLETLVKQYGEKKVSKPTADQPEVTVEALIDPEKTRVEWKKVKNLVLNEGYPRGQMTVLWGLIHKHYKNEFPNLLTLAAIALTAPIHTADCERGFSAQNATRTAARNRLSSEKLDDILSIKIEGAPMKEFDFVEVLQE